MGDPKLTTTKRVTGKDLYDLGVKKVGSKYRLGVVVPKNDRNWAGAFDCAEFTSWIVYQRTGKLYGCANNNGNPATADAYTGFYKRDADRMGVIITVERAMRVKGAFLLRYAGSGLIGHIVMSDGNGGTVEAANTRVGVIKGRATGRRWDIGILLPSSVYDVDYSDEDKRVDPNPPKYIIYRWTSPLMNGTAIRENVRAIQRALNKNGAKLDPDGWYGSKTFHAVREFQNRKKLIPDGEVGHNTAKALGIYDQLYK